ncbi:hypothetical protein BLNAU_5653 [Blattamonas nauphoetae]|uniref:Uncharacterized protein n=1 Tax=Blattamonas nauphoetae TaxID=2049346 RepID=A0ABQ9Y6L5_9EUKA|nr:hypothetical protein BLNAU_5653 [Blattamonas nauphoetae]
MSFGGQKNSLQIPITTSEANRSSLFSLGGGTQGRNVFGSGPTQSKSTPETPSTQTQQSSNKKPTSIQVPQQNTKTAVYIPPTSPLATYQSLPSRKSSPQPIQLDSQQIVQSVPMYLNSDQSSAPRTSKGVRFNQPSSQSPQNAQSPNDINIPERQPSPRQVTRFSPTPDPRQSRQQVTHVQPVATHTPVTPITAQFPVTNTAPQKSDLNSDVFGVHQPPSIPQPQPDAQRSTSPSSRVGHPQLRSTAGSSTVAARRKSARKAPQFAPKAISPLSYLADSGLTQQSPADSLEFKPLYELPPENRASSALSCSKCPEKDKIIHSLRLQLVEAQNQAKAANTEKDALASLLSQNTIAHKKEIDELTRQISSAHQSPTPSVPSAKDSNIPTQNPTSPQIEDRINVSLQNELRTQQEDIRRRELDLVEKEGRITEKERILAEREASVRSGEGRAMELLAEIERKAKSIQDMPTQSALSSVQTDMEKNRLKEYEKSLKAREAQLAEALIAFDNKVRANDARIREFVVLSDEVLRREKHATLQTAQLEKEWERVKAEFTRLEDEKSKIEAGMSQLFEKERQLDTRKAEIVQLKEEATNQSVVLTQSLLNISTDQHRRKARRAKQDRNDALAQSMLSSIESPSESSSETESEREMVLSRSMDELELSGQRNRSTSTEKKKKSKKQRRDDEPDSHRRSTITSSPARTSLSPNRRSRHNTRDSVDRQQSRHRQSHNKARPMIVTNSSQANTSLLHSFIKQIDEKRRDVMNQSRLDVSSFPVSSISLVQPSSVPSSPHLSSSFNHSEFGLNDSSFVTPAQAFLRSVHNSSQPVPHQVDFFPHSSSDFSHSSISHANRHQRSSLPLRHEPILSDSIVLSPLDVQPAPSTRQLEDTTRLDTSFFNVTPSFSYPDTAVNAGSFAAPHRATPISSIVWKEGEAGSSTDVVSVELEGDEKEEEVTRPSTDDRRMWPRCVHQKIHSSPSQRMSMKMGMRMGIGVWCATRRRLGSTWSRNEQHP